MPKTPVKPERQADPRRDDKGRFGPDNNANPNGRPPAEFSRAERLRERLQDRACTSVKFSALALELGLDPEVVTINDVLIERDLLESGGGSDAHSRIVYDRTDGPVKQLVEIEGSQDVVVRTPFTVENKPK